MGYSWYAGVREDRLQAKLDRSEARAALLASDLDACMRSRTLAEGDLAVLEGALDRWRRSAQIDSALAADRARRSGAVIAGLRKRLADIAKDDTTDWTWRDLYY